MRIVNVLSTVTEVAPKANKVVRRWITLQNTSDVNIVMHFDDDHATVLTADNGFILKPGETLSLRSEEESEEGSNHITAIHASTGNKVLRIQEGN